MAVVTSSLLHQNISEQLEANVPFSVFWTSCHVAVAVAAMIVVVVAVIVDIAVLTIKFFSYFYWIDSGIALRSRQRASIEDIVKSCYVPGGQSQSLQSSNPRFHPLLPSCCALRCSAIFNHMHCYVALNAWSIDAVSMMMCEYCVKTNSRVGLRH